MIGNYFACQSVPIFANEIIETMANTKERSQRFLKDRRYLELKGQKNRRKVKQRYFKICNEAS